jgi:nicotinamidase-related amidase
MSEGKALLIIDVQVMPFIWKDYGGKELFQSKQLLANINRLIDKARAAHAPVIYIQYTEGDDSYRGKGQPLWEIHPQIQPQSDDIVILKYRADSFYDTSLHEQLKVLQINHLVIVGVQTEFCVDTTCRTSFSLGYKNILVSDGHSTFDSDILTASQIIDHHNEVISCGQFAELKRTDEVDF